VTATVPGASDTTLTPVSTLIGATVTGPDGATVGTVADLMMTTAPGTLVYVALCVGGIAGIGERMFAVPWSAFVVDPVAATLTVGFVRADLDGRDGFDKDAWPTAADAALLPAA
jgi:sporulation protein YlmC with PRC-barrel domain